LWLVTNHVETGGGPLGFGLYGGPYNTNILESHRLLCSWWLVTYMRKVGQEGCWLNIVSYFASPDGRTRWMCYSSNCTKGSKGDPRGNKYALCLQEIKLVPANLKANSGGSPGNGGEGPYALSR
jgi:hypothetical protein